MSHRTFASAAPVALGPTLAVTAVGRSDPTIRIEDAGALMAVRLPSGPATLRLTGKGREITAEAWGDGADEALERAPGIVGAADDPKGFDPTDRPLRELARRHRGIRVTRSGMVAAVLIATAVQQKVTGKEAKASYRRMAMAVGEPAPGPGGLVLPPEPSRLAGMAYHRFHPFGIERKRAETIIRIARHARRLDETAALPLADAYRRIRAVPGVGPWTAAFAGMAALGDPDAVPVGDDNLPDSVAWLLAGEPRADDERMLELLEPYRGHRGRVIRLVKAAGRKAPRFGPRRRLRDIGGI